uniref:Uncharacterized protein n=1 Tax=Siphoviridae sp. cttqT1 TaxID=2827961 RepID=A0A8S5TP14_9CAUD|nr:MAG TPA: hypothetical protein [Siphoviridae sp. cttqT1]
MSIIATSLSLFCPFFRCLIAFLDQQYTALYFLGLLQLLNSI